MEILVGEITRLKNIEQTVSARMDAEIAAVRKRYEEPLSDAAEGLLLRMVAAQEWAGANPSEFGKLRSIDMTQAVIGWRTGQPQLKTLSGWTWDRVLERLASVAQYMGFVRTKQEVDKQGIIAARENLLPEDLRQMGVRIIQEESFFVEPKLTEVETKVQSEAA